MIGGWPTREEERELDRVIEESRRRKDCLVVRELKGGGGRGGWYCFDDEREPTTESRAIAAAKEIAARSPGTRIGVAKLIFEARMTGMESGGFKAEFE